MKYLYILALIIFSSSAAIAQDIYLIDTWEDEKLQIVYRFEDDESLYFSQQGYGVFADYEIDFSYQPYRMELIVKNGMQEVRIPALLKVVDENTIWIEQFAPGQTPVEFTEGEQGKRTVHKLKRN